jgi:septal ring factor EnvC (AmiA/AmiB activator)
LAIILLIPALAHAGDEKAAEADLREVQRDIVELQQAIRTETTRRDSLAARLRDAELTVAGARQRLDQLRAQRIRQPSARGPAGAAGRGRNLARGGAQRRRRSAAGGLHHRSR